MRREIAGWERCSALRRVGDAASPVDRQKGIERIAVHVWLMQKADDLERINKFG
jgi:hypothetical protein